MFWCPNSDSNRDWTVFETVASANWATGACEARVTRSGIVPHLYCNVAMHTELSGSIQYQILQVLSRQMPDHDGFVVTHG
jgi:hypothetical protein